MNTRRLALAVLIAALAGGQGGCGGSSTSPSVVALTVTGSWDVTIVTDAVQGGSVPGIMTLTETGGSVTGSLQIANGSESLSGTVSQAGEMALAYRDPVDGERGLIQVTVDAARRSFTGNFTITPAQGEGGTLPIRGTKR